jgi:hypothetical protein
MVKAGLSADVIAAKIRNSRCDCDTSPATLMKLKADGIPDSVVLAMVEATKPAVPTGLTDIRAARTAYLINQSTDNKVFNELPKRLEKWGKWKLVERPEDADILLVFSASQVFFGSMTTGSVYGTGTYATGTATSVPLMSLPRYLTAVDRTSNRQLLAVSCERRLGSGYTAGVLVNRMRKEIDKLDKPKTAQ